MNEIIVMVTRMETDNYPDEWINIWGFDIHNDKLYINKTGVNKSNDSKDCGIILIHGSNKACQMIYNAISEENLNYEKAIIGIHAGGGKGIEEIKQEFISNLNSTSNISFFDRVVAYSLGNTPSEEFIKIATELQIADTYDDAKKRLLAFLCKKKANNEYLSLLKHKIAHLFLSIDMDLQGIAEVKREDIKGTAQNKYIDYLKEVLQHKTNSAYYNKVLCDLQFMIVGNKLAREIPTNIIEEDLSEKKSILDLIDDKKDPTPIKNDWNKLMELCGLVEKDGGISSNKDSIICKFMEMMGKKASKNENEIDNKDVNDILEFFKKDENKIQGINSFHDWFCALDNCLEKIREAIK